MKGERSDWHPIDYGHINLVKPTGTDDVRYIKAKDFLIQCRPPLDRLALLRLREISDKLLEARRQPYCRDWDYEVHIHDANGYAEDDSLLVAGFSPYVVARCRYRAILNETTVRIGFSIGSNAADAVWHNNLAYVHQILTRELPDEEQTALSKVIDQVLSSDNKAQSWATLFPKMVLVLTFANHRYELVADAIERGNNLMIREFVVPKELSVAVGEEVTFDLEAVA
jgi:hypothetical protein